MSSDPDTALTTRATASKVEVPVVSVASIDDKHDEVPQINSESGAEDEPPDLKHGEGYMPNLKPPAGENSEEPLECVKNKISTDSSESVSLQERPADKNSEVSLECVKNKTSTDSSESVSLEPPADENSEVPLECVMNKISTDSSESVSPDSSDTNAATDQDKKPGVSKDPEAERLSQSPGYVEGNISKEGPVLNPVPQERLDDQHHTDPLNTETDHSNVKLASTKAEQSTESNSREPDESDTFDSNASGPQPVPAELKSDGQEQGDDLIRHTLHTSLLSEDQKLLFVSVKSSVLIVNGVKNKMLKNWLKILKIKPKANDRALEYREAILDYVQDIMERKVVPPPKFIKSFIEQLADEAIDDEMNYQLLKATSSQTSMGKKKKMIKDRVLYQHYPNMVHNHDTINYKPVSPISLFTKTKDNPKTAAKTTATKDTPALHSPTTSPSPSGVDSEWSDSSKDTRKKRKTKKKKKKMVETTADAQTQDKNLRKGGEKTDKNQKKDPTTKVKEANTEVEPPNKSSQLEFALELLEKRVIDIDLEQPALKDCIKKETTTQNSCLSLLLEEDKKNKKTSSQQLEKAFNKQIGPLVARIQALETTTSSLKDGFELQTQNMEKIVDEIRSLRHQAEENKKGVDHLQVQLEMIKERQRDIGAQLINTKPPKTKSTSPDDTAESKDTTVPGRDRATSSNTMCVCKRGMPKVTSTGSQTSASYSQRDLMREDADDIITQNNKPDSDRKPDTINNQHHHKRREPNQPRAQGNPHETRSIGNMMTMTASATSAIHQSRLLQSNPSLDVPTWTLEPNVTSKETEKTHNQQGKSKAALGPQINEKRPANQPNAANIEPRAYSHTRRKCLLVHDSTLSGFDGDKFSRTFDVTLYPAGSCLALNKDRRFEEKLRSLSPECIFVHLGIMDILSQRTPKRIADEFKELIWYLLENTKAQLCFSLIIPTKNGNSLNTKIREFNELLTKLISDARAAKHVHKSCLFSYSNDSVEHHNIFNQGTHEVRLTEIGKRIMWSRLCDGFNKTLRLPRRQLSRTRSSGRQPSQPRQNNIQTRSHNG